MYVASHLPLTPEMMAHFIQKFVLDHAHYPRELSGEEGGRMTYMDPHYIQRDDFFNYLVHYMLIMKPENLNGHQCQMKDKL